MNKISDAIIYGIGLATLSAIVLSVFTLINWYDINIQLERKDQTEEVKVCKNFLINKYLDYKLSREDM